MPFPQLLAHLFITLSCSNCIIKCIENVLCTTSIEEEMNHPIAVSPEYFELDSFRICVIEILPDLNHHVNNFGFILEWPTELCF